MKRRLISFAVFITGLMTLPAAAYEYPYLNFKTADGTVQTMTVDGMTIEFSGGSMLVSNDEGSRTFTLTAMDKMYFSSSSGLAELLSDTEQQVDVYNDAGVLLGRFADARLALDSLERGIYVLKGRTVTLKIAVK